MNVVTSKRGLLGMRCYFVVVLMFLYAPLLVLVLFSFNSSPVPSFPLSGFTTKWYSAFLDNPDMTSALLTSVKVAALSSCVAVTIAVLASYAVVRYRFRGRIAATAFLLTPLILPYVVLGVALLLFFKAVGVELSLWTVVIGHVMVTIPYAILVVVPRLAELGRDTEDAARDLGASPFASFWLVTRPLLAPALVSAFVIGFTISFDEYAVASFIIGDQVTFPVYLYSSLRYANTLPEVLAVAVVVLTISFVLIGLSEGIRGARHRWRSRVPKDRAAGGAGTVAR